MQTNIATSPPLAQPRGLSRRFRLWILLGLQAIVFVAVTRPLFRTILVSAGESDARDAVRLIARELGASEALPHGDLAAWLKQRPMVQHRLADVRIVGKHLEYHGYQITLEAPGSGDLATDGGRGTVWAVPIDQGRTGRTHFHISVD